MTETIAITAIVTAFKRGPQTIETIRRIYECEPCPDEVIVHVDGTGSCEEEIRRVFPHLKMIVSPRRIGPGGARNKLISAARNELVASFDDDSYPIDQDYFGRAVTVCQKFANAAIVCAALYHQGENIGHDDQTAQWTADFCSGACIYRRTAFLQLSGYVPVPLAYGIEEVDLALRLHANGKKILYTSWLRVFHNNDLTAHNDPAVTASSIANTALLAYLRYPFSLWWIGLGQCLKRIFWLLRRRRWRGIVSGLSMIPAHLRNHQAYKMRVSGERIRSYLLLRRSSVSESF